MWVVFYWVENHNDNKKLSYRREIALQVGAQRQQGLYSVHLRLVGKLVVDFLLVMIELFSLGVTAEPPRANIDWKSSFLKQVGYSGPKF